mmetsp:Transcript_20924/g.64388  ORF Transcript_20924/g.64388 Transcript_20924/m.64388 type:complete len:515 (-) Transcript_20924:42-1586(-)
MHAFHALRRAALAAPLLARALSAPPSSLSLTRSLAPKLLDFGEVHEPTSTRVLETFATPEEIYAAFADAGVDVELRDGDAPQDAAALERACGVTLSHSVRTRHPLFLNQLYGGVDDASLAGEWLVAAANTNAHTFEVAPVFTVVERAVIARVAALAGWGAGADGLTTPGGSTSNLYGLHLAAHKADPNRRSRGAAGGPTLVAFVSGDSHYSFKKSCRVLGLGDDNVIAVPTDAEGRMRGDALTSAVADAKAAGKTPFFVGSTAGTTVRGAFDAIDEVAAICEAEGLWHHVDGSWGGSALWDADASARWLKGIEKCDSFVVNPHKLMNVALSCSVFVTAPKNAGALVATNAAEAPYLFQPDKANTDLDAGDRTIMCGRRPDAFKLWLMWKAIGDVGMAHRVQRCLELAAHVRKRVVEATDGSLELVFGGGDFANVLFRAVPPKLREHRDPEALGRVAPLVKKRMQERGDALVGFQAQGGEVNFFRLVITQGETLTEAMLDTMLETMVAYAAEDEH